MRIEPNQTQFNGYIIKAKDNKQCKFLYNKAHEILTQEQQTITFATDYIKFDKMTDKIKLGLEKFKILWKEIK